MTNILALKSSISGDNSSSSQLIEQLLSKYKRQANINIIEHDLASQPLPILDAEIVQAMRGAEELNNKQQQALALSEKLIAEVKRSDVLILAAPMYNFMIPTQLKNWFDLIICAGKTFTYTEQGPQGLISGTRAIVVTTRGGIHKDQESDQQVPYLKTLLTFIGIRDVEIVYAEALAMGDDVAAFNLDKARQQLAVVA